ncbi:MAG TPA: putative toxin-antitoxin system toxin component, PIN family [Fervidobacterium sp.]|nr:putative toxin-antitoxin system toxin component, PIN family [Fervidobacterium sp.]
MKEKRIVNNVNNHQVRVFLDSNVLLTAVCNENSDSAKLLQLCKEGKLVGIISQEVLHECHYKLKSYPELQEKFNGLVQNLEIVEISDKDIEKYTAMITDLNDRHVLAGAEVGCADYLVTLNWKHFFSSSAKKRLAGYPIPRVFPGILTSSFRQKQLPRIEIYTTEGTFAIGVDPQWNSKIIRNAERPFFVLDFPGVFSIWYEPARFQIKMRTEVYESNEVLTFPRYINDSDAFLCIVTWDAIHGFSCMVDGKLKRITRRWHKIPTENALWIGSDRNGANQINSLLVFHGWPRALTEKEMRRVFEGGYVTLPEKPASL